MGRTAVGERSAGLIVMPVVKVGSERVPLNVDSGNAATDHRQAGCRVYLGNVVGAGAVGKSLTFSPFYAGELFPYPAENAHLHLRYIPSLRHTYR